MRYKKKYEGRIKFFYHVGVIAFLLGFGLALVPQPGAAAYGFLWIASGVAFVAVAVNACLDVKRAWNNRNIADRGGGGVWRTPSVISGPGSGGHPAAGRCPSPPDAPLLLCSLTPPRMGKPGVRPQRG